MKKVLINVSFKDRYTGKVYTAGKTYDMTAERVAEVKEVNPNFVDVVGNVEEPDAEPETPAEPETKAKNSTKKK